MGYRVSWIARAGASTAELLKVSRRKLTGERHEFPDVGFYLLELPGADSNPWVVLIADGSDNFAELDATLAQSLSVGGHETLFYWCSDTVMATEMMCFKNGANVWSIQYDCEDETQRPKLTGDIPPVVQDILKNLRAQQQRDDGADYIYDLTAEVGRSLVGFRHDVDAATDDPEPFQVLED